MEVIGIWRKRDPEELEKDLLQLKKHSQLISVEDASPRQTMTAKKIYRKTEKASMLIPLIIVIERDFDDVLS